MRNLVPACGLLTVVWRCDNNISEVLAAANWSETLHRVTFSPNVHHYGDRGRWWGYPSNIICQAVAQRKTQVQANHHHTHTYLRLASDGGRRGHRGPLYEWCGRCGRDERMSRDDVDPIWRRQSVSPCASARRRCILRGGRVLQHTVEPSRVVRACGSAYSARQRCVN